MSTKLPHPQKSIFKYQDIEIITPSLTKEKKLIQKLSDFNDLEKLRGRKFVKQEILNQLDKIILSTTLQF